jgi:hypothetical protein
MPTAPRPGLGFASTHNTNTPPVRYSMDDAKSHETNPYAEIASASAAQKGDTPARDAGFVANTN